MGSMRMLQSNQKQKKGRQFWRFFPLKETYSVFKNDAILLSLPQRIFAFLYPELKPNYILTVQDFTTVHESQQSKQKFSMSLFKEHFISRIVSKLNLNISTSLILNSFQAKFFSGQLISFAFAFGEKLQKPRVSWNSIAIQF
jgi:hypothetical protein